MSKARTYSSQGPTCPYCGSIISPDEGCYYDEHRYTEQDCPECEKTFSVEVHTSTSWACEPKEAA